MKKLFCAVMLLLMGIVGSVSFAKENKVLYVGTNAEFQPFEYLEDGKIVGFDVELMEEIAELMGKEIEWKNIAFDGLLPALQAKKLDVIIAGMTATEERKKFVNFSETYYTSNQMILINVLNYTKKQIISYLVKIMEQFHYIMVSYNLLLNHM